MPRIVFRTALSTLKRHASCLALGVSLSLASAPMASAQLITLDPANLIQNALTAARELEQLANQAAQIANQLRSLENEARNLTNLNQNLTPDFVAALRQMDGVITAATGVQLNTQSTQAALQALYTGDYAGTTTAARAQAAQAQLDAARASLRTSLLLQAQATEQIRSDQATLGTLSDASSNAQGALAIGQATNEYIAFTAQENLRLQQILVANQRAEALEQQRQLEARALASAEHTHFFGTATTAYPGAPPWN